MPCSDLTISKASPADLPDDLEILSKPFLAISLSSLGNVPTTNSTTNTIPRAHRQEDHVPRHPLYRPPYPVRIGSGRGSHREAGVDGSRKDIMSRLSTSHLPLHLLILQSRFIPPMWVCNPRIFYSHTSCTYIARCSRFSRKFGRSITSTEPLPNRHLGPLNCRGRHGD